ncbi:MAG: FAD-dependent oxidoreductase [Cyanobacteria bacterium P01_A01_bin.15]
MANCDYDLAILGGSIGSRLAACRAAQQGARVAFIAPSWGTVDATRGVFQALHSSALRSEPTSAWPSLGDWMHHQRDRTALSQAALRCQGIDVILEPARFTHDLALTLAARQLRASRYLLTDGYGLSRPVVPAVNGLLVHQLTQLKTLPERLTLVGYGATAVEWAYALSQLARVTLVPLARSLLPAEDHDIQRLSEAQLRCLGITIASVDQAALQSGRVGAEGDLVVVVPQLYGWDKLALDDAGIASEPFITANRYLQTPCPHIYASGGSLGGENRPELAQQETTLALDNALFGRRHAMDYGQTFYSIDLVSPVGRWGLTEHQATQRYGNGVQIVQAACLPPDADHSAQTNFCKLIILGQRLIGVHLMGDGAPTWVTNLGRNPTVHCLSQRSVASFQPGTLGEAIYQALGQWQSDRWSEGQWRRDWAENWFNWRRSV